MQQPHCVNVGALPGLSLKGMCSSDSNGEAQIRLAATVCAAFEVADTNGSKSPHSLGDCKSRKLKGLCLPHLGTNKTLTKE